MTIIVTRIVTPYPGHFDDALQFARKRVAALKDVLGLDVSINTRIGGPAGQLNMVVYCEDMAEMEDMRRKIIEGVGAGTIPQSEPGTIQSVEDSIWMRM